MNTHQTGSSRSSTTFYSKRKKFVTDSSQRSHIAFDRRAALQSRTLPTHLQEKPEQLTVDVAREWLNSSEAILTNGRLSPIGFTNFLMDPDQWVFERSCATVYHDMTQPLSHYFIATSHNTYTPPHTAAFTCTCMFKPCKTVGGFSGT